MWKGKRKKGRHEEMFGVYVPRIGAIITQSAAIGGK
jgi:hypothetical protein